MNSQTTIPNKLATLTPDEISPSQYFPGLVATEVIFCVLFSALVSANSAIFFMCKIYKNISSFVILALLTLLNASRMVQLLIRLVNDEWQYDEYEFNRLCTDVSTYLFGLVCVILLFQWHQTYRVLANPLQALNYMQNKQSVVYPLIFTIVYSLFFIIDVIFVVVDAQNKYNLPAVTDIDTIFGVIYGLI